MDHNRLKMAMNKYRKSRVSLGRAAEIAGLPIIEFLSKMKQYDVTLNYDINEFEKDLKSL